MGGKTKTAGMYQQTQHCSQILSYIKATGQDPFSLLTYCKLMSSQEFASVFTSRDKSHDVRMYFVRILKLSQKNEKLQLLNSIQNDFESSFNTDDGITKDTAIQNPQTIIALAQYEKKKPHTIFGMRIPDGLTERKKFIHCKNNLRKYQEYLYLEHDILVDKSIDLLNALYGLYIFNVDLNTLLNCKKEIGMNSKIMAPNPNKLFQVGNKAMKFHLLYRGEAQRSEALQLQSLIESKGGMCVSDSRRAEKIILLGQEKEWITETNAWKCHVYTTGLVWQAIGTGKYDSSKDAQFRVNLHNTRNENPCNFITQQNIDLTIRESLALGPERKKTKLSIDESCMQTINDKNISIANQVFNGMEFYVYCSKKGEINKRNQIWKLIRENGGKLSDAPTKSTINILIGPYTLAIAESTRQKEFDYYDPLFVTDTVVIGEFLQDDAIVYKYTDDDIVDGEITSGSIHNKKETAIVAAKNAMKKEISIVLKNSEKQCSDKDDCDEPELQPDKTGNEKTDLTNSIKKPDNVPINNDNLNVEEENLRPASASCLNKTEALGATVVITETGANAGTDAAVFNKADTTTGFINIDEKQENTIISILDVKCENTIITSGYNFIEYQSGEANSIQGSSNTDEKIPDKPHGNALDTKLLDESDTFENADCNFLNSDKVARRFACFLEESLKRPEETVKKIAEILKPMMFLQFQDDVSVKTLQNNIRTMFKQWEKDGDKFEEQMMKRGVSEQAINHSKKF